MANIRRKLTISRFHTNQQPRLHGAVSKIVGMYSEAAVCIGVFAIACLLVAIPMFAGTKRETLWDKDNVVAVTLLGIALLAHGGFDTFRRSSSQTTFEGYVLGWDGGPGSSGWIYLYDLGYPPTREWVGAPYRVVHIPLLNEVPNEVWNTDSVWMLRVTYRVRDLQAVTIEGIPTPPLKNAGRKEWAWQSNERLLRPIVEALMGLVLVVTGAIALMVRNRGRVVDSVRPNPA